MENEHTRHVRGLFADLEARLLARTVEGHAEIPAAQLVGRVGARILAGGPEKGSHLVVHRVAIENSLSGAIHGVDPSAAVEARGIFKWPKGIWHGYAMQHVYRRVAWGGWHNFAGNRRRRGRRPTDAEAWRNCRRTEAGEHLPAR